MKFAKTLAAEAVPEWALMYINYRALKKVLTKMLKSDPHLPPLQPHSPILQSLPHTDAHRAILTASPQSTHVRFIDGDISEMNLNATTPGSESTTNPSSRHPSNEHTDPPSTLVHASDRSTSVDTCSSHQSTNKPANLRDRALTRASSLRSNYSNFRKRMAFNAPPAPVPEEPVGSIAEFLLTRPPLEAEFFALLDAEMRKINKFFYEQVSHHLKLVAHINEVVLQILTQQAPSCSSSTPPSFSSTSSSAGKRKSSTFPAAFLDPEKSFLNIFRPTYFNDSKVSKLKILKSALLEEYRALTYLRNYQILNYTGTVGWRSSRLYVSERSALIKWEQDPIVRATLVQVESLYCKQFAGGKRQVAMQQLRLPDHRSDTYQKETWCSGFYLGVGLCLFVQSIVSIFSNDMHNRVYFVSLTQIYGGFLMPILFSICFTWCLYKWSACGVNYVFIFGFDFRQHIHYLQFLQLPSFLFLLWSVFVFLTLCPANDYIGINPLILPLVFLMVILIIFVNPLPILQRSARYWLLRTLFRILSSPLHKILFRDFYVADILCSHVYSLTSIPLFFYVSIHGDLDSDPSRSFISLAMALFPYAVRFVQCFRRTFDSHNRHPHLTNAVKYVLSMSVILTSFIWRCHGAQPWMHSWIVISVLAAVYSITWDCVYDWGLLDRNHQFLRAERSFPCTAMYYFALISNVLLRLGWVIVCLCSCTDQISPSQWLPTIPSSAISLILAILEVLRRVQWCLYRMENEHLTNCGQFRATKDIPLPRMQRSPADEENDNIDDRSVDIEAGLPAPTKNTRIYGTSSGEMAAIH